MQDDAEMLMVLSSSCNETMVERLLACKPTRKRPCKASLGWLADSQWPLKFVRDSRREGAHLLCGVNVRLDSIAPLENVQVLQVGLGRPVVELMLQLTEPVLHQARLARLSGPALSPYRPRSSTAERRSILLLLLLLKLGIGRGRRGGRARGRGGRAAVLDGRT